MGTGPTREDVLEILDRSAPKGAYEGVRAITTQTYTEANSKLGAEHEGSTLLIAVAGGAENDTIFLTGAKTVSLKGRVIGFTGKGVTAKWSFSLTNEPPVKPSLFFLAILNSSYVKGDQCRPNLINRL